MDFASKLSYIGCTLQINYSMDRIRIKLSNRIPKLESGMTVYYYSDIDEDVVQCEVISVVGDTAHLRDLQDSAIFATYDNVVNKWVVFETYLYRPIKVVYNSLILSWYERYSN